MIESDNTTFIKIISYFSLLFISWLAPFYCSKPEEIKFE